MICFYLLIIKLIVNRFAVLPTVQAYTQKKAGFNSRSLRYLAKPGYYDKLNPRPKHGHLTIYLFSNQNRQISREKK